MAESPKFGGSKLSPQRTHFLRCRFCRASLLTTNKLAASHQENPNKCGNCLYLDETEIQKWTWIQSQVDDSGWTKGRLYCPGAKCNARLGGFDYVQGVLCSCGVLTIPAIWIKDGFVDNFVAPDVSHPKTVPRMTSKAEDSEMRTELTCQKDCVPERKICVPTSKYSEMKKTQSEPVSSNNSQHTSDSSQTSGVVQCSNKTNNTSRNIKDKMPKPVPKRQNRTLTTQRVTLCVNRFRNLNVEEPKLQPAPKFNGIPQIADHLTCPVCLDCFYKPYKCPCDHTFCDPCLRQLYHVRSGTLKCPVCRSPVKYIEVAEDLRNEIRKSHRTLVTEREVHERKAKYKNWELPPIGPLPFLKKRRPLVPPEDTRLITLSAVLLSIVCGFILYVGMNLG